MLLEGSRAAWLPAAGTGRQRPAPAQNVWGSLGAGCPLAACDVRRAKRRSCGTRRQVGLSVARADGPLRLRGAAGPSTHHAVAKGGDAPVGRGRARPGTRAAPRDLLPASTWEVRGENKNPKLRIRGSAQKPPVTSLWVLKPGRRRSNCSTDLGQRIPRLWASVSSAVRSKRRKNPTSWECGAKGYKAVSESPGDLVKMHIPTRQI